MSKSKIDRLFQTKLEHQEIEPSQQARDKFHALIDKRAKKSAIIWGRAAAAVLLIAISGLVYWKFQPNSDTNSLANQPMEELNTPLANNDALNSDSIQKENKMNNSSETEGQINNQNAEEFLAQTDADKKNTPPGQPGGEASIVEAKTNAIKINTDPVAIATIETKEELDDPDIIEIESLKENTMIAGLEAASKPEKKRLPVTIIYKSSKADDSFVAMEQFQDDLDSLEDDQSKPLGSIIQTAANSSIISELRNAKNDLLKLDIPAKTRKANN